MNAITPSVDFAPPVDLIKDKARLAPKRPKVEFAILHGNLSPLGCVIRLNCSATHNIEGTARVFDTQDDVLSAINSGDIRLGHVLILTSRFDVAAIAKALNIGGLSHVTLVCEERFDGTHQGIVVSNISPNAKAGGPIGRVKTDDIIRIDIEARQINLLSRIAANTPTEPALSGKKSFAPLDKYTAMLKSHEDDSGAKEV